MHTTGCSSLGGLFPVAHEANRHKPSEFKTIAFAVAICIAAYAVLVVGAILSAHTMSLFLGLTTMLAVLIVLAIAQLVEQVAANVTNQAEQMCVELTNYLSCVNQKIESIEKEIAATRCFVPGDATHSPRQEDQDRAPKNASINELPFQTVESPDQVFIPADDMKRARTYQGHWARHEVWTSSVHPQKGDSAGSDYSRIAAISRRNDIPLAIGDDGAWRMSTRSLVRRPRKE